MYINTHTHPNVEEFKDDWREVIQRALDGGVWSVVVGIDLKSSQKAIEIAHSFGNGVFAAVGLHPTNVPKEFFDQGAYERLAHDPKVVAIGEVGLDFFDMPKDEGLMKDLKRKQQAVLLRQIEIAKENRLPVLFHCRNAYEDLVLIADKTFNKGSFVPNVLHCFNGDDNEAAEFIARGFYIGINGMIFKHDLDKTVRSIPLERILLETDDPYLTPPMAPVDRNEPLFVKYVSARIAQTKAVSMEKVAQVTSNNAYKVFSKISR